MESKIKVKINDATILVPKGITVMQACELAGEEIPRFCYHDRLSIAGNCRMCLVEIEKSPKPVASCAMPVAQDMVIKTTTEKVKKARKGVMEFLLINHPLDCPICDQGGECDLQDQSIYYGKSTSRYRENKRAVEDKNFGPLIKTVMTRCIHCTRCVRFMDEVAGSHELGAINRGEHMEITSTLKNGLKSELSGNIIDLCPVGALTSKPYAFTARSWELNHFSSIDITDSTCSSIRIDEFGGEVKRILPRINEDVNQEWISDKARFSYDGLTNQRIDKPYIKKYSKLSECDWEKALNIFKSKISSLKNEQIAALSGSTTDTETLFVVKNLFEKLRIYNIDCRNNLSRGNFESRKDWLFNAGIGGIDKADKLLLIGCDPKRETPVLNSRIRQKWLTSDLEIKGLCVPEDLNYHIDNLGDDISSVANEIFIEKIKNFFSSAKYPMIIFGDNILVSKQGRRIHQAIKRLAYNCHVVNKVWNGLCYLSPNASRVGGLEVDFIPKNEEFAAFNLEKRIKEKKVKLLILIENDDFDCNKHKEDDLYIIYIGHHGDRNANFADLILPSTAYTEKKSLFINLEGRPQFTAKVTKGLGSAVDSWKIFRALADKFNYNSEYNTHMELLDLIYKDYPHLSFTNKVVPAENILEQISQEDIISEDIKVKIENYYQTCSITRSSNNMANCAKELLQLESNQ